MASACAFTARLLKEKNAVLKDRLGRCGLLLTGTKDEMVQRLVEAKHATSAKVDKIVSIDMGLKNLAFVEISRDGKVHQWRRLAVGMEELYDVSKSPAIVQRFRENELPANADKFIIEEQRHRSGGRAAMPETVFRLCVLEAQLHCYLHPRSASLRPGRVAQLFQLPKGPTKKAASTRLVTELLESTDSGTSTIAGISPVVPSVPAKLRDLFFSEKKRDDLSDCMLQALAFFTWQHNIALLRAESASIGCSCPSCQPTSS